MSLGIVFKGPEGIVLAADSRVTLTAKVEGQNVLIPATFDNATKLLKIENQDFVGAVTYGQGAIGEQAPRTAHSFLPEFEDTLVKRYQTKRLAVEEFAGGLGEFFMEKWNADKPSQGPPIVDIVFLIGGYDEGDLYGKIFEVRIPSNPVPKEFNQGSNFGPVWGGQRQYVDRIIHGYDPRLADIINNVLKPPKDREEEFKQSLRKLGIPIPYQFLPLQDCVDLSIFLIRTTITLQKWQVDIRGVGGDIDVATITRTDGFQPLQQRRIRGETFELER